MAIFKLQSAMEYLMTYGWAILIIAVVLGALFGLGFFNSANLAPKVSSGSCQVYRPFGAGTTTNINTEGVCNNELPQYVASFSQATFAGISASAPGVSTAANAINTVTFWMLYKGSGTSTALALGSGTGIGINTGYLGFTGGAESYGISSSSYNNQWVFVAAQIQNGVAASSANDILYINGAKQSSLGGGSAPTMTATQSVYIGSNGVAQTFNGLLANVQIYNYSLSGNEIVALYDSGIGADPQAITNIAGWWPLNGNPNDYSGNLNNGVATNVVYTSSWTAGYTAP